MSGFSIAEILRAAGSLKVWVLEHFEIVVVRRGGLQVLLAMVVLFHRDQSCYRGSRIVSKI